MGYRDWIPFDYCEMPKEGEQCLVTYGDMSRMLAYFVGDVEDVTLEYAEKHHHGFVIWDWNHGTGRYREIKGVTAWQRLPEPYGSI